MQYKVTLLRVNPSATKFQLSKNRSSIYSFLYPSLPIHQEVLSSHRVVSKCNKSHKAQSFSSLPSIIIKAKHKSISSFQLFFFLLQLNRLHYKKTASHCPKLILLSEIQDTLINKIMKIKPFINFFITLKENLTGNSKSSSNCKK